VRGRCLITKSRSKLGNIERVQRAPRVRVTTLLVNRLWTCFLLLEWHTHLHGGDSILLGAWDGVQGIRPDLRLVQHELCDARIEQAD
jgi:hypothetical protein